MSDKPQNNNGGNNILEQIKKGMVKQRMEELKKSVTPLMKKDVELESEIKELEKQREENIMKISELVAEADLDENTVRQILGG